MIILSFNKELINKGLENIFSNLSVQFVSKNNFLITEIENLETIVIIGQSKFSLELNDHFQSNQIKYILLLDGVYDRYLISSYIKQKIKGFITLNSSKEEIYHCVESVKTGCVYFSPEFAQLFMNSTLKSKQFELSERETEILDLLAKGKTLQEISEKLFLSSHTVISHKRNILKKTGFSKMTQLIAWWLN